MDNELLNRKNDADMILLAIGDEVVMNLDENEIIDLLRNLNLFLDHTNYFIVATFDNEILRKSDLNQKRIVYPYKAESDQNEEKQWELYNKWLSATLAKKLLILELGEGFKNPNIVRWPFERITMINNTAFMYRVHSELSQIPVEIQNKAKSIQENAYLYLKDMLKDCE